MPQLNDNRTQLYTHLVKKIHSQKFTLYSSFSSFLWSLENGIEDQITALNAVLDSLPNRFLT